ncbi:MAG: NAD-dependent succinate-semialdehyde dehydrogenase [Chloroflexi bacterium]|nr:NAD-dependent succinate-semialdehyde dehydrogenase [Chloroflexota bacterium]
MTTLQSINPTTEEVLAEFEEDSPREVEAALESSIEAFRHWRNTSYQERSDVLLDLAKRLRLGSPVLAQLMTREMGKPIVEAEAEIEKCAWCCEYYAEHLESFLRDQPKPTAAAESYVAFDPLGPVLAIMAWNFPFWQVFRFGVPALAAGNTILLKHASLVPQCSLAIAQLFAETGFPLGTLQSVFISGGRASELIGDQRIAAISFVGSERAGASVAKRSGAALKKVVLELGGSDPFIVLPDADLGAAVATAVKARYQNAGQDCIAAKRFIVFDSIADEFISRFTVAVEELRVDDPCRRTTEIGPLAAGTVRAAIEDQVSRSIAAGATLVAGGRRMERRGYFYSPTLLTDVRPGMPVFDEETFGPVAAISRAATVDEAICLANHSAYGLGAAIWSQDVAAARQLARRVESGMVFINGMVASDPRLPFGGVKRSGYGRELGEFGIREFVNVKTIWVGPRRDEAVP